MLALMSLTYGHPTGTTASGQGGCYSILFPFLLISFKAEPLWTLKAFSGTTVWGRAEHGLGHCCPGIMIPHQQGKPQALL